MILDLIDNPVGLFFKTFPHHVKVMKNKYSPSETSSFFLKIFSMVFFHYRFNEHIDALEVILTLIVLEKG